MIEYFGRKLLHNLPAEMAHDLSLKLLSSPLSKLACKKPKDNPIELLGMKFPNPVGLAAGFDKNASAIKGLDNLGFGFLEFGTVTPKAQMGNPKPRLFRLSQNQAIINRMGFNNNGVDSLINNVENVSSSSNSIIGINIGKNKNTPNVNAIDDYSIALKKVYQFADYVTINISSPNTKNLRDLQEVNQLKLFLNQLKVLHSSLAEKHKNYKPMLVKIAPDQDNNTTAEMANCIKKSGIDGIICSNTTLSRNNLKKEKNIHQDGGLSGKPLLASSNEALRVIRSEVGEEFPLIGVGGILTADDALSKIAAGANLVQIYTGFIYNGPNLIHEINNTI